MTLLALLLIVLPPGPAGAPARDSLREVDLAARVEIVRTEHGVPHVFAQDLEAMGFALGWLQSEDHGDATALSLVKGRGEYARHVGRDSIDGDFEAVETYARAVETYHRLLPGTRAVYEGFAAGVNHYIRIHPDDFPAWMRPDFNGIDAHALEVQGWSRGDAERFVRVMEERAADTLGGIRGRTPGPEPQSPARGWGDTRDEADAFLMDGSNAWAFAPARTTSGHAILLRNPHLTWGAGYYEAHVRVPGVLEFYGDFRIGSAFGIIGGFNRRLGWATTNNYPTYSQVYALGKDPDRPDHYLLDGRSNPLAARAVTVSYRTASGGLADETRVIRQTPYGPVIHESDEAFYILKDPRDGEFRRGEQFLLMMQSGSLEEWLGVMAMRAHPSSNFTYADADGNIAHLYNARLPLLPHEPTGDTAAVARSSADMWSELVPVADLPLWLNPPGGYVQQANDTPDYTNLNVLVDRDTLPANLPPRRLRPRSQLSLLLAHGDDRRSLEDVLRLKHSPRMLMAERVVEELLEAIRARTDEPRLLHAARVLEAWDRTADADARGAVLFKEWEAAYTAAIDTARFFREPWTPDRPMETPVGIGEPDAAITALAAALDTLAARGWAPDIPWGEIHRVIRGEVDVPVSGCEPTLGCFRALSFQETEDGRRAANRGDAWVLAVEFGPEPRARSILAYGQSPREDSPFHADQAALFARGETKPVAWTEADILHRAVRRYHPGG